MFLVKLLHFIKGYVVITVTGKYPERFLNVCATRHILLWNLFSCSKTVLRCSISRRGFRQLIPLARKAGVRVKIIEKKGFPVIWGRLKKRWWFTAGILAFAVFMIVLNLFVWDIEIVGCKALMPAQIEKQLSIYGLKIGSFRPKIDEKQLQQNMLLAIPELSWLWVDKQGSKVKVEVRERVPVPEIYNKDAPYNIIAEKDGVIEDMQVLNGTPMVSIGDTVCRGDILVSGLIVSEKGVEPRQVHAEGKVYARVWYEKTKAVSLWRPVKHETGRTEEKRKVHLFGLTIPLYFSEKTKFSQYREEIQTNSFSVFGFDTGMGLTTIKRWEERTEEEKMTPETMAGAAKLDIEAQIDSIAGSDSYRKESQMSFREIDEDTIEVVVTAEYIEDIAKKIPLS